MSIYFFSCSGFGVYSRKTLVSCCSSSFSSGRRGITCPGPLRSYLKVPAIRASTVDSYESSPDFVNRLEKAWIISEQPRPIVCSSCKSKGHVECKWCQGTGFFVLGDSLICEVPSRNTSCLVCEGKGLACCPDCKGTGFRAKWLGEPPSSSSHSP